MRHQTTTQPTDDDDVDAQIIDLPAVIAPVRQLVAWYDDLLADKDPPKGGLNHALTKIKALPNIPGRLGRDIALMANGGRGATRHEVIGALERLRPIAHMNPRPAPAGTTRTRKRRTTAQPPQATLPGMGTK